MHAAAERIIARAPLRPVRAPQAQRLSRTLGQRRPCATNPTPMVISTIPAQRAGEIGVVQPELRQQRDDDVAERCCRKHIRQIGPRKRSQIAGEESDQQRNADRNPWREDGGDQRDRMRQRNRRHGRHAARKARVAERRAERHESQDQVLARLESLVRHAAIVLAIELQIATSDEEGRNPSRTPPSDSFDRTLRARAHRSGRFGLLAARFLHHLVALRAKLQERPWPPRRAAARRDSRSPSRPRGTPPWGGSSTRRRSGAPSPCT